MKWPFTQTQCPTSGDPPSTPTPSKTASSTPSPYPQPTSTPSQHVSPPSTASSTPFCPWTSSASAACPCSTSCESRTASSSSSRCTFPHPARARKWAKSFTRTTCASSTTSRPCSTSFAPRLQTTSVVLLPSFWSCWLCSVAGSLNKAKKEVVAVERDPLKTAMAPVRHRPNRSNSSSNSTQLRGHSSSSSYNNNYNSNNSSSSNYNLPSSNLDSKT